MTNHIAKVDHAAAPVASCRQSVIGAKRRQRTLDRAAKTQGKSLWKTLARAAVAAVLCLAGILAIYAAWWAIRYRIPASPPEVIDRRTDMRAPLYCVTLCASLADNPHGFPGHAYVICSIGLPFDPRRDGATAPASFDRTALGGAGNLQAPGGAADRQAFGSAGDRRACYGDAFAFVPRCYFDQPRSLVRFVPGEVVHHAERGNQRNLDRVSVLVDRKTYEEVEQLATHWDAAKFRAGVRDCVALTDAAAHILRLQTPEHAFVFPQDYIRELKEMN